MYDDNDRVNDTNTKSMMMMMKLPILPCAEKPES